MVQGLPRFVTTRTPFNFPGGPTYLSVLSFLLVQNNDVPYATAFNESGLGGISLKQGASAPGAL